MFPKEGPLQNLMHRAKQAFEPPGCIMRDILFNSPLAEMSGALPALIIKKETNRLWLNLTQEKKIASISGSG